VRRLIAWLRRSRRAETAHPKPAKRGEQRFTRFVDMDPHTARIAALQQEPQKPEPAPKGLSPDAARW
jgi:hypothetical protein